jgi:hypothetical protein
VLYTFSGTEILHSFSVIFVLATAYEFSLRHRITVESTCGLQNLDGKLVKKALQRWSDAKGFDARAVMCRPTAATDSGGRFKRMRAATLGAASQCAAASVCFQKPGCSLIHAAKMGCAADRESSWPRVCMNAAGLDMETYTVLLKRRAMESSRARGSCRIIHATGIANEHHSPIRELGIPSAFRPMSTPGRTGLVKNHVR